MIYDDYYEECYSIGDFGYYDFHLFGDTFLRGQYVIHDIANERMAIVGLTKSDPPPSSSDVVTSSSDVPIGSSSDVI